MPNLKSLRPFPSSHKHANVKGLVSKRTVLKVELSQDHQICCLQACMCTPFSSETYRLGSEGVKSGSRKLEDKANSSTSKARRSRLVQIKVPCVVHWSGWASLRLRQCTLSLAPGIWRRRQQHQKLSTTPCFTTSLHLLLLSWCFTSSETTRLIRDGKREEGGRVEMTE